MPSVINSDDGVSSGTAGLKTSGSNDGITVFQQNGTESARITAAGNVGIGTSSPTQELHLYKDQNAATEILIENPNTGTSGRALLELSPELGFAYFTANSSTSTVSAIAGGALGAGLYTSSGLSNGLSVGTTAGALKFFAGSTSAERARIDSSGNLLVGTTSGSDRFIVKSAGTSSAASAITIQNSAGTELMRIRNDGVFYTGGATFSPYNNTTASAANVVVGASGDLFRSTSSLKYKQDVADATHGLAELMQLRPVTYKGKSEADGNKVFGGLIAEEVHQAGLTEFVQYAEDGSPDAIAYGNMVSLCIKAIQELKAELDATKAEVAALKARTT